MSADQGEREDSESRLPAGAHLVRRGHLARANLLGEQAPLGLLHRHRLSYSADHRPGEDEQVGERLEQEEDKVGRLVEEEESTGVAWLDGWRRHSLVQNVVPRAQVSSSVQVCQVGLRARVRRR